jgi:hypothetical protein
MPEVEVIQVVRTELTLRGDGKSDPMRRVAQYWSLDGRLLAETDPLGAADRPGGGDQGAGVDVGAAGEAGVGGQAQRSDPGSRPII